MGSIPAEVRPPEGPRLGQELPRDFKPPEERVVLKGQRELVLVHHVEDHDLVPFVPEMAQGFFQRREIHEKIGDF